MKCVGLLQLLLLKALTVAHGERSASLYLAYPTFRIPSDSAVIILFLKCPSASTVVTSTLS